MESVFKARKRDGAPKPSFTPLSERMMQGGGYKNGAPPHGLNNQMMQGSGGYSHAMPKTGRKLRDLMGQ